MVSNEVYVGAGASVTLVQETKLNLGGVNYKSYGLTSRGLNNLVKYSVGTNFRDRFKLIPNLYAGCEVYLCSGGTSAGSMYATIAANDVDSIYLDGKLDDFPDLSVANSYMEIQPLGTPIPAPILTGSNAARTYEDASLSASQNTITVADTSIYNIGDKLYSDAALTTFLGRVISIDDGTTLRFISVANITATADMTNGSPNITMSESVDGVIEAGSEISIIDDADSSVDVHTVKSVNGTAVVLTSNYLGTTDNSENVRLGRVSSGNTLSSAALYVDEGRLLSSDSWLGLANTVTPPNVEVEMKQLNLALSGSRNFAYQFKGAETVSGGSMDLSLNNGSWLYYALGRITAIGGETLTGGTSPNNAHGFTAAESASRLFMANSDGLADDISGPFIYRTVKGAKGLIPPVIGGVTAADVDLLTAPTVGSLLTYTIAEANGEALPSFTLEVNYEKGSLTDPQVDNLNPNENVKSAIITGNQINSLTLNFEEGQELKTSLDFSGLTYFDAPNKYILRNYRGTDSDTRTHANLFNFSTVDSINKPFFYFDGAIKVFGTPFARVKTGSLTITNNLTQHRFINNTNRQRMSTQIPGQRTYELSFTALVTDSKIWDELRKDLEFGGVADGQEIQLQFTKDNNEQISLILKDYLVSASNWPIPEDKGPIEVEMTVMARNLETCTYTGAWLIQG
jgi:hypothetical protein